jgi:hypothetical protein
MDYNIREFLKDQIHEIDIFKWDLGVKMNIDPLTIFTLNEIYEMWINLNAMKFRNEWMEKQKWNQ